MANMLQNMKGVFADTRSRLIIIFTGVVVIGAVLVGLYSLSDRTEGPASRARITQTPGSIKSIPGSVDPTAQYAKLQEKQNIDQAKKAVRTGKSAIPTIIRVQKFGKGQKGIGTGQGGVGFVTLGAGQNGSALKSLWFDNLKQSNCGADALQSALKQGASLQDAKEICSCAQLKSNNIPLTQLKTVCQCPELKAVGVSATDFRNDGFTATQLQICGFDACQLRSAGYTAAQLKQAGFTDGELKGAGFSDAEIKLARGLPDGISVADVRNAGCDPNNLRKLRKAGVSARAIREISGCSATAMKAAGYTARELRDAGYTAAQLKAAGFTAKQLRNAGYSAKDLLDAGYTPAQLKEAGYSDAEIKTAQITAGTPIEKALDALKKQGCSIALIRKARDAGATAKQIRDVAGCSASAMKAAGFSAKELKDAGYTAAELKAAGFSAKELKNAGFTAKQLADAGFSAKELKAAGFSAKELKAAGFSAKELKAAGFSDAAIKAAGYNDTELQAAGILSPVKQQPTLQTPIIPQSSNLPPVKRVGGSDVTDKQLQKILQRQASVISERKLQQQLQSRQTKMQGAASQVIAGWKPATQQYEKCEDLPTAQDGNAASNAIGAGNNSQGQEVGGKAFIGKPLIKAGDILFAVLNTAVNSDEPGPVLATIVSGDYKGSKLIGSFQRPPNAKKLVLSFTTISMKNIDRTVNINAVAIDPDTGRTALADHVNSHVLLRYGSLFASGFLEGFGSAITSDGTTINLSGTTGTTEVIQPSRTLLENAGVAAGKVGQRWGTVLEPIFNTPPTVKINSGASLGVLFTRDVQRPR